MTPIRTPTLRAALICILTLAVGLPVLLMSGCATINEDVLKMQAEARIQTEKTEQARLATLSALAGGEKAGEGARVAGIMALVQAPRSLGQSTPILAQRNWADYMMQALGLAVQVHGINSGRDVSIAQSNNSRDISLASYGALAETAGLIQAPQPNITASGAGASTGGAGNWHWEQIGPDSNNTTSGDTSTTTDSHDATATPTVVTQPPPVILRPEVVQPIIWTPAP